MTIYTPTGPFTSGAAPGIDAGFLNNLENAFTGSLMMYLLGSPYQLTANPTVTAGSTTTLTCTGVGGVPSGSKAAVIGVNLYSVTAGGTCQIAPHGGTLGNYINITPQWTSNNIYTGSGMVIAQLDASGKIDVKAVSQNMVLQNWYMYAHFM